MLNNHSTVWCRANHALLLFFFSRPKRKTERWLGKWNSRETDLVLLSCLAPNGSDQVCRLQTIFNFSPIDAQKTAGAAGGRRGAQTAGNVRLMHLCVTPDSLLETWIFLYKISAIGCEKVQLKNWFYRVNFHAAKPERSVKRARIFKGQTGSETAFISA